jgi:hypothetical protein
MFVMLPLRSADMGPLGVAAQLRGGGKPVIEVGR